LLNNIVAVSLFRFLIEFFFDSLSINLEPSSFKVLSLILLKNYLKIICLYLLNKLSLINQKNEIYEKI
ncbi:MAG TPA: hypothetical protein PLT17_05720, partial [Chitinophagales bacterium]|nr:hypothetical protein [Chitinophagales bacterium]